ncbi:hypothetical protein SRHO_G00333350 [Serrasalmus rhombeus]
MRSMKGTTTGRHLVNASMDKLGLKWDKLEHESEHSDIAYQTAVRWLSLGKMLKRVWDLRAQIQEFCEKKGEDIPELSDTHWMADLALANE